ncbi:MAG: hypothetical protein AB7I35_09665 [Ramlibacter sp.]
MDYLKTLDLHFAAAAAEIAQHEKAIAALKAKQQKIQTARAIHSELGLDSIGQPNLAGFGDLPIQINAHAWPAGEKLPSLRLMILEELKLDSPMTKETMVKRLHERYGFTPNESTVGSTLSKMAARGEIEKAGHFAYRLKSEVPNGGQPVETSGATSSADDN